MLKFQGYGILYLGHSFVRLRRFSVVTSGSGTNRSSERSRKRRIG